MTFLRLALLKSPAMMEVRVFVDVSTEHIVEFGQSQASVCLWWNVNSSSNNRRKLPGADGMGGR